MVTKVKTPIIIIGIQNKNDWQFFSIGVVFEALVVLVVLVGLVLLVVVIRLVTSKILLVSVRLIVVIAFTILNVHKDEFVNGSENDLQVWSKVTTPLKFKN